MDVNFCLKKNTMEVNLQCKTIHEAKILLRTFDGIKHLKADKIKHLKAFWWKTNFDER